MKREEQFLRSKEVADVPDSTPNDVYKAILRGEVPATKRGMYWFFHYEDVIAYSERQKVSSKTR